MLRKTQFRFLAMAILATLAVALPGVSADGQGDEAPPIPEKRELKYPNLGSHLDQLVAQVEDEEMSEGEAAGQAAIHKEELVAVTIHLSGSVDDVVSFLEDNGGDPRNVGEDYIEAYVPVALLGSLSEQSGVIRVREIVPPQPAYGPITSQGVQAHAAAAWHQAGITGQGVKVGIIDTGFEGIRSLMGAELPTTVVARCYTDIGVFTGNLSDCENEGVHGTAVAEAVMDIAPEVSLYVANSGTKGDLQAAADWMVSEGVSVINTSLVFYFDGPGDGTSPLSISPLNTVDRAVNRGVIWVTAAGNEGRGTWFKRAPYQDADGDDCIEFATGDEVNGIELVADQPIRVQLRWADSWGGATSDLDLYLQRSSELVATSVDYQSGGPGHNPFEQITGRVRVSGLYGVGVCHYGGSIPDWIQVVVWDVGSIEHYTGEGSISNPGESDDLGMLAVGATHYWDTHTIADYSSRGPTPDGRTKPDIVGTACGKTASYELEDPERFGNDCWFSGTSQAAPHVAGMAALVRQRFSDYTPQQVAAYLKDHAERRGTVPNNTWGYGFAVLPAHDAVAAKSPGPPSNLTATASGPAGIDLSWNPPANNGGAAITGYRIEVSTDGSAWSDLVADTNTTGTTYSHTGLTAGSTRHYRVSAINSAGTGPASNKASATTAQPSDLVIESLGVDNSNPAAGASFTLSVTVRNQGSGPSTSTTLRYYRSTDAAITTGDTAVGTDSVGGLNASGTSPESISLTAPSTAGTYYYGACVDAVSGESNTGNNCSAAVPVTVRAAPAEREALVALYEATGGSNWYNNRNWLSNAPLGDWYGVDTDADGRVTSLNLRRNGLTGEIPPELGDLTSLESVHLHDNDLSGCVPVALRGVAVRGARLPFCDALAGGIPAAPAWIKYEHIDVSFAPDHVNVWWAETPGAYWYQTGKLGEVEAPATATIDGETCGFIFEFFCGGPPYKVRACNADGCSGWTHTLPLSPADVQYQRDGSTIVVSWSSVTNADHYKVYHHNSDSSSCRLDSSGNPSSCEELTGAVVGTSFTHTNPDENANYYWVVACNNAGCSEIDSANPATFVGGPPAPTSPPNQRYVWQGSTTVVSWDAVSGADHYTVYYDDFFSSSCSLSFGGSPSFCDELATNIRGTSYTHTSPDEDDNYYWVVACNSGGCSDIDSANSARFIDTRTPDLVMDRPTVDVSAPTAGASFTLSATVRNHGSGPSASSTLRYYRSADSTITTSDTSVGMDSVSGLDALETADESISLTAPSTPGTYYYGACVDAVSDESDTTNNCSTAVTVTVGAAPAPDLVVDRPTVDVSAPTAGASFTLSATVRNQGGSTAGSTTLTYYRSTDATIYTSDTSVGTDPVSGLSAGNTSAESISVTAPSTAGTYYYGACVDAVTNESDTTNNCSSAVIVTVGAAPASATRSFSPPSVDAGGPVEVTITAAGYGAFGAVVETLPAGFDYVSSSLPGDSVTDQGRQLSFILLGEPSFTYTLTAPSTEGSYSFSGVLKSFGGEEVPVGGAATLTVGPATDGDPLVDHYDTNNNGTIDRSEVISAINDYLFGGTGSITRADVIRLINLYLFGPSTPTQNPPGAPQGLTAAANGTSRMDLSWRAPPNDGGAAITGYRIEVSEDLKSWNDLVADTRSTATTYFHTSLTAGSTRHYRVSAINSAGTGPASNIATGITDSGSQPAPDLVVETPSVDDGTPDAGAAFTLSATVRNQGDGASPPTTLRYYRSSDSTITSADTPVGTDSVGGLDASGTSAESITLTAPDTPGTYHYGACVDAVAGETDSGNNCSAAVTVAVGAAPAPDLVVETPSVSDSTPDAGAAFTLSATVRNQGDGVSEFTTLHYYRSTDSAISASDTPAGTDAVGGLNASGTSAESITLTAPETPGTYYYGACVDAVAGETDSGNNCSAAVTVAVGAAPAPDLVVETPSVSDSTPDAGAAFTLSATVRNQGDGASAPTTLRYYRSADSAITSADTPAGTDSVGGLNASETSAETIRLTAPDTPGTYHYGACVDAVSGETDPGNNCSAAVTVSVGAALAPDLVVDPPSVSDSTPDAGASFTLSATVRNRGDGASGFTTLHYYRSTDSTITAADTQVGTDDLVLYLNALDSSDKWTDLTAPETPGTYYYGACVDAVPDESDTTNNCSTAVTVAVGAAPAPDLVVETPSVDDGTPDAGAAFTLSATVRNRGDGASAPTTLRYYRSADSAISASDTPAGTDAVGGLNASGTSAESITLTAPDTPGTYHYGACVDAVAGETDPGNNCSAAVTVSVRAAPAPDLVVETPSVDDGTPDAGTAFTLSATVRNQGDGASAPTTLRYYRSSDSTITSADTPVGTDSVDGLDASGTSAESITLTAPDTPGTYHYGACVDAVAGETDPGNNCSAAVTVAVGAAPAPDLVVETPSVSDSTPDAGAAFTLSATVRNRGDGASAPTTLRYYRSSDSTISASDTPAGTDSVGGLNASGTSAESITLTAPDTPGTYRYGACVDAVPDESDTTNNCSTAVTVSVGAAPAPACSPGSDPTPLHLAVENGDIEDVRALAVSCPEDLNAISDHYFYEQTPLSLAIANEDADITRILVDAGADPNKKVNPAFSVGTHLTYAVGLGYADIVQILLDADADPNVIDTEQFYDQTPLSLAIGADNEDMVRKLIAAGADPNKKVNPAFSVGTHLTYAVGLGYADIVQILLDADADPNVIDTEQFYDQTPLSLAIGADNEDMVRKLIAAGADPNKKVNPAFSVGTHLTYAVGLGYADIVQILLDADADPNVIDTEQFYEESPLSLAVKARNVDMVRILVAAGADPHLELDQFERVSPLDIAIAEGYTEIVAILTGSS